MNFGHICRGKWLHAQFGFANHLALNACFISYEKWVLTENKSPFKARLPFVCNSYLVHIVREDMDTGVGRDGEGFGHFRDALVRLGRVEESATPP